MICIQYIYILCIDIMIRRNCIWTFITGWFYVFAMLVHMPAPGIETTRLWFQLGPLTLLLISWVTQPGLAGLLAQQHIWCRHEFDNQNIKHTHNCDTSFVDTTCFGTWFCFPIQEAMPIRRFFQFWLAEMFFSSSSYRWSPSEEWSSVWHQFIKFKFSVPLSTHPISTKQKSLPLVIDWPTFMISNSPGAILPLAFSCSSATVQAQCPGTGSSNNLFASCEPPVISDSKKTFCSFATAKIVEIESRLNQIEGPFTKFGSTFVR